jgi:hypothetical protein
MASIEPIAYAKYDCIVVGAGISGLYATRELLKKHPTWRIALCERYKGFGGRTYSYWVPGVKDTHWEMGAGRIHKDHTLLMGLLKDYGLHWVPIGEKIDYKAGPNAPLEPNLFETVIVPTMLGPLTSLSKDLLAKHTIEELMVKVYGTAATTSALAQFPYRAEVNTLRADLALDGFLGGGEMSSHKGYGVLAEGFSELVSRMKAEIQERGGFCLPRHQLLSLKKGPGSATDLTFKFGYPEKDEPHGTIQLRAEKCVVLALHRDAVAELPEFQGWKPLRLLKTQPLLRCYAIFRDASWFSGLGRVVSPELPRYILPMDPKKGTIMISYTDGDDTQTYMKIQEKSGDKALEKVVMKDVRRLFPEKRIPNPEFFRSHPWKTGCTYWLPGLYNPEKVSEESCHPLPSKLPNVYLCGESWSMRQAWVEGSLEQTKMCLGLLRS